MAILKPEGVELGSQKRAVVQYYINRILKVDDVAQTIDLDFYLKVNWIDEQWIGVSDDDFQDNEDRFSSAWWEPGEPPFLRRCSFERSLMPLRSHQVSR